jgi:hypothetical protein
VNVRIDTPSERLISELEEDRDRLRAERAALKLRVGALEKALAERPVFGAVFTCPDGRALEVPDATMRQILGDPVWESLTRPRELAVIFEVAEVDAASGVITFRPVER